MALQTKWVCPFKAKSMVPDSVFHHRTIPLSLADVIAYHRERTPPSPSRHALLWTVHSGRVQDPILAPLAWSLPLQYSCLLVKNHSCKIKGSWVVGSSDVLSSSGVVKAISPSPSPIINTFPPDRNVQDIRIQMVSTKGSSSNWIPSIRILLKLAVRNQLSARMTFLRLAPWNCAESNWPPELSAPGMLTPRRSASLRCTLA